MLQEGYSESDTILITAEGEERHYYVNGSKIVLDGESYLIGNGIDITDRVKAEKVNLILLQEIHHRVKNNLAIISGILGLKLHELRDDNPNRITLERSINRVKTIAKVHEFLYRKNDFSQIYINEYVTGLVGTVLDTLETEYNVDLNLYIEEVDMNLNEVITLGMLLNELLTNSFKYALENQDEGRITLQIRPQDDSYQDNGHGFDRSSFDNSETMGFTIIKVLLEQLDANYELNTQNGFKISFTFEKRQRGPYSNM